MNRFATLLDRLSYTPSRDGKIALMADYLRSAPDPDRGYALAALCNELSFDVPFRKTVVELAARVDRDRARGPGRAALRPPGDVRPGGEEISAGDDVVVGQTEERENIAIVHPGLDFILARLDGFGRSENLRMPQETRSRLDGSLFLENIRCSLQACSGRHNNCHIPVSPA